MNCHLSKNIGFFIISVEVKEKKSMLQDILAKFGLIYLTHRKRIIKVILIQTIKFMYPTNFLGK